VLCPIHKRSGCGASDLSSYVQRFSHQSGMLLAPLQEILTSASLSNPLLHTPVCIHAVVRHKKKDIQGSIGDRNSIRIEQRVVRLIRRFISATYTLVPKISSETRCCSYISSTPRCSDWAHGNFYLHSRLFSQASVSRLSHKQLDVRQAL
jgi:hypothetical protein